MIEQNKEEGQAVYEMFIGIRNQSEFVYEEWNALPLLAKQAWAVIGYARSQTKADAKDTEIAILQQRCYGLKKQLEIITEREWWLDAQNLRLSIRVNKLEKYKSEYFEKCNEIADLRQRIVDTEELHN